MSQTTYSENPNQFVAGGEYEGRGGANELLTKFIEGTDVLYGYGVSRSTSAGKRKDSVILPTADTEEFMGVAAFEQNEDGYYKAGNPISVATNMSIAVKCVNGLTILPGEPAYVIVAAGADRGKFTNVATANLSTGMRFQTSMGNDDLAAVRLNLSK